MRGRPGVHAHDTPSRKNPTHGNSNLSLPLAPGLHELNVDATSHDDRPLGRVNVLQRGQNLNLPLGRQVEEDKASVSIVLGMRCPYGESATPAELRLPRHPPGRKTEDGHASLGPT
eukprot:11187316-Lingulodinium_polyedra.AAC.1